MEGQGAKMGGGSVTIGVAGMHCAACVAAVERALRKVDGVTDARVNFASEKATVEFDPSFVTVAALEHAIEEAGYEPRATDPPGRLHTATVPVRRGLSLSRPVPRRVRNRVRDANRDTDAHVDAVRTFLYRRLQCGW